MSEVGENRRAYVNEMVRLYILDWSMLENSPATILEEGVTLAELWLRCPVCERDEYKPPERMFLIQIGDDVVHVQNLTTFFELEERDNTVVFSGLDDQFDFGQSQLFMACGDCIESDGIDTNAVPSVKVKFPEEKLQ